MLEACMLAHMLSPHTHIHTRSLTYSLYPPPLSLSLSLSLSPPSPPQISSGHCIEEDLQLQLCEKRQQIVNFEHQINRYRDEMATLKGHLATSEEVCATSQPIHPYQPKFPWLGT